MNTLEKKQLAHAHRVAWRKERTQRANARRLASGRNGELAPAEFDVGVVADPTDGTLNKDVVGAGLGLDVLVPMYELLPEPNDTNDIVVYWAAGDTPADEDFEEVDRETVTGPLTAEDFPRRLTVDHMYLLQQGPFTIRYSVFAWNGSETRSVPVPLIVDTIPPWGDVEPAQITVPAEPITDDYFATNPTGVACTLPAYPDWQAGDILTYWWVTLPLPDDPLDLEPVGSLPITAVPMTLEVPPQTVQDGGDGGCAILYAISDKATNRSRLSFYTRVAVALGPLPAELKPPLVPLADDGQVDRMDVATGVDVEIPAFLNAKATDWVEVTWGSTKLPAEQLGSAPPFPYPIRVPVQVLVDEYTGPGPETVTVSYVVRRGDVVHGPEQADVAVDLSVIGPDNPDFPDPINPNLPPPKVFGTVSGVENTLGREDYEQDARLEMVLYDPINPDEIIDFYWDGALVTEARHTITTEAPNDPLSVVIPWKYILASGNVVDLPVHYRIYAPGSPNEQHSPTTLVNANAVVHTPEAPQFLRLSDPGGVLNCESLDPSDHAVLAQVPDLTKYLAVGDEVTMVWTPAHPRTTGEHIIETAIKTETFTLDAETVKGFVWRITPYADYILPIYDIGENRSGRGRVHYTLTYQGELLTSANHDVMVGMWYSDDSSCDVS